MQKNNQKSMAMILLLTVAALFVVIAILLLSDQQKNRVTTPQKEEQQLAQAEPSQNEKDIEAVGNTETDTTQAAEKTDETAVQQSVADAGSDSSAEKEQIQTTEKQDNAEAGSQSDAAEQSEGLEDYEEQPDDDLEDAAGMVYGYTNLGIVKIDDYISIWESADSSSKVVGKMEQNTCCEVLSMDDDFAHIISGSVEGYVQSKYLVTGPEAEQQAADIVKEVASVTTVGLILHELPSKKGKVYTRVYYGEELEFIEELGEDWVGVKYDGHEVFCDAEFVSVGPKLPTALNMDEFIYGDGISAKSIELCEFAKQFIGNPYVWGGTSLTNGADCSGFCQSVFAHFNIRLPRTSREQAKVGIEIPPSKAKPGDLVFYDKDGTINHVAICIGGGQIVNASSPKTGIRTANMYYRNPVKVVRVLEDY